MVGCAYIFQAKRHDSGAKNTNGDVESRLLFICRWHMDLIVPTKTIYKGEHLIPDNIVKQKIWHCKCILGAHLVEIPKIHTDAELAIFLFHRDYIGKPLRILHFPDEFCLLQLCDLSYN